VKVAATFAAANWIGKSLFAATGIRCITAFGSIALGRERRQKELSGTSDGRHWHI